MDNIIEPEFKVEYTLKRWPETIPIFLKYRMGCVGCAMSSFESLSGAADIYKLPLQNFLNELEEAISSR